MRVEVIDPEDHDPLECDVT